MKEHPADGTEPVARARKGWTKVAPEVFFARAMAAYSVYYDVERAGATPPFDAEARFSTRESRYFLTRRLPLSEEASHERVYFALRARLEREELDALHALAWERGLAEARPGPDHKCTDVTLFVVAGTVAAELKGRVRAYTHSKLYRFGLWGFSNYRLAVVETSTGTAFLNRHGRVLAKLVENLWQAAG